MKTTVISSEVEKFGKLSEEWWNPNGGLRALHSMNGIRYIINYPKKCLFSYYLNNAF
jgi:2-polyprenyl-3-methyl-5-hydroxy-6-metoxy-1,4-benzoquinol methylase